MSDRCYHLSKLSGGCARGQAYSDMKRKYVHDLCAVSVICTRREGNCVQLGYDSPCGLILILRTKCSYSHAILGLLFSMQISLQSWVMLPLNGDTSLENFSYRRTILLQFLEAKVNPKGSVDLAAD